MNLLGPWTIRRARLGPYYFTLHCLLAAALCLMTVGPAVAAEPVELVVKNLTGDALANVRSALALPRGLVRNGDVNMLWLDRFTADIPEKVRTALEPFGYYRAEARVDREETGENRYRITVAVQPGEPVRLSEVKVALHGPGASEKQLLALVERFPLKTGDVPVQRKYEEAKGALRSSAAALGFLDAEFSVHRIEIDPERGSARILLELMTGPRYRFDGLRFEGARHYSEAYLRRYATFVPGDVFSYAKLGEMQLNLLNTDRFTEIIPVPEKENARDAAVPVVVRLQEAPARRLRPGIGYATDVGPRLSLEYRDLNAFDRGDEFHAESGLSFRRQNLGAGYIIHDKKDINSSTGLETDLNREVAGTHITRTVSAEIDRNRAFGQGRLGTLYLRFAQEISTIADETVRSRLVLPGVRYSERRIDSMTRPSRGHTFSIDLHGTHEDLGSSSRFVQVETDGGLLTPLPARLTLLTRLRVGATLQNDPFKEIPVSLRFFAGGDQSVRGYAYQSLGPLDDAGRVIGGRNLLVGSVELDRAFFTNWAGAVFYDAGNAFNSFEEISLFEGAGVGVRYYTVIGGLRLDVARRINVPRPGYRLHFTVGIAF